MPPLQHNATLERVTTKGGADDFDRAGAAPVEKWAGELRVYYRRKVERVITGQGVTPDVVTTRTLIVANDELPAGLDTDDVLTFTPDGGDQETGTAQAIAGPDLAVVSALLRTTRIELEPA